MNPSQYNLFFKAQDRFLLFNIKSGSKLFVDAELKDVIEKGDLDRLDPDILEQLSLCRVVVDSAADELQKFAQLYQQRVYVPFEYEFTIIPTYDCNLTCYYCKRSEKTLSPEQVEKFKDFFSKELKKGDFENVAVRIGGGEPLLHPKMLFEMLEGLSKITEEHNKKFFSALVTNGTLLTEEILDRLSFLHAVQVTLEGCRSYHDSVRHWKTGTFDQVFQSAEMIKDAGILLNVRVHVSEKNITGLQELFDELRSSHLLGPKTLITAAPVVPTGMCPFYPSLCTESFEAVTLLPRVWETAQECGILISQMPHPVYEVLPCPYVTPTSLILDPFGDFYKCLMAAGERTHSVGSLERGLHSAEAFHMVTRKPWQVEECKTCTLLVVCGGGCPWEGYKTKKTYHEAGCGMSRVLLRERIRFHLRTEHSIVE